MFALNEIYEGLYQVLLTPPRGLEQLWWGQTSVLICTGGVPSIIDTGPPGTGEALTAALSELDLQPSDVRRVALTSSLPSSMGNLPMFDRAMVYRGAGSDPLTEIEGGDATREPELDRWRQILATLMQVEGRPTGWDESAAISTIESWSKGARWGGTYAELADNEQLILGTHSWQPELLQGGLVASTAWFSDSCATLAPGGLISGDGLPHIRNAAAWLMALDRLASRNPRILVPGHTEVPINPRIAFRSAGLLVQGVLSNFLYLLSGPTMLLDVVFRDLGGWPEDVLAALRAMIRYDVLVRELLSDGVIVCEGDPLEAPLVGGSAQGPRTPSLLRMVRDARTARSS